MKAKGMSLLLLHRQKLIYTGCSTTTLFCQNCSGHLMCLKGGQLVVTCQCHLFIPYIQTLHYSLQCKHYIACDKRKLVDIGQQCWGGMARLPLLVRKAYQGIISLRKKNYTHTIHSMEIRLSVICRTVMKILLCARGNFIMLRYMCV